ncbi:MAG: AMP-binding protein [Mycobacteriales bacterium]
MPEPAAEELTVPELLRRHARERPDQPFLEQVEDGRSSTYAQVAATVERVAAGLRSLGVGRNDRVVTILPNVAESAVAWFACMRLGAVECPVGVGYKGPLLVSLLDSADARVLVASRSVLADLEPVLGAVPGLEHLVVVDVPGSSAPAPQAPAGRTVWSWEQLADLGEPDRLEEVPLGMSDVACMLFTSGTTGGSRGVLCTFAQEYESAVAAPPGLDRSEAIYATSPPNHVGQKLLLYKSLVAGCRLVMRSSFSLSHFWSDVRESGSTHTLLLGGATSYLLSEPVRDGEDDSPLRSVLMIPIHPDVNTFRARFGVAVHSMFNMTEICPVTSISDEDIVDHRSCGRVRPGFDWRLVDEFDEPVPLGEPGELVLRPEKPWQFSRGYWRDDAKTVDAWRNLWFHTGDVFVTDESLQLRYLDRRKDVVRRRGENISSAELESIAVAHDQVEEVAVIGVPSEHTEEDIKLVVVPRQVGFDDALDIFCFLEQRVPRFMLPRYVEFVPELPKTPTLKVRKGELRAGGVSGRLHDVQELSRSRRKGGSS